MTLKQTSAALLLFLSALGLVNAAGTPVTEDLSQLISLSDEMIELGKNGDANGFTKLANTALSLMEENRNNSMVFPRASAKFRAAKSSVKVGKFEDGVEAVKQAKLIMSKKAPLSWDGGSN